MNEAFPCNGCGACCRSINLSKLTEFLDRGDGVCKHFDTMENSCTIYANRPEICNVRAMYDKHYSNDYGWPAFVALNKSICEKLLERL